MTDTSDLIRDCETLHHLYGYDDEGVCHDTEAEADAYTLAGAKVSWQLTQPDSTLSKILKKVAGTNYFEGQERDKEDFWSLIIAYWRETMAAAKKAPEPLVKNLRSLASSFRKAFVTYASKVQKKLMSEGTRSPPKIFLPIPNKTELGGCARSDSLICSLNF